MRNLWIVIVIGIILSFGTYAFADDEIRQAVSFSAAIEVDGKEAHEVEALTYNDSVYVPLRFVAERLGAAVSYDGESRSVSILSGQAGSLLYDPDFPGVYVGDVRVKNGDQGAAASGLIMLDDAGVEEAAKAQADKGSLTFSGVLVFYDRNEQAVGTSMLGYRFPSGQSPYRIHRFEAPVQGEVTGEYTVKLYGGYLIGSGETPRPPTPQIAAGSRRLPVAVGTYCWYVCLDKAGVGVMLDRDKAAVVSAGEKINVSFGGNSKPTSVNMYRIGSGGRYDAFKLADGTFRAPMETGVYSYAISAKWGGFLSGDAAYGFIIRVE